MSLDIRKAIVASPLTRFSAAVTDPNEIRTDLLDPARTDAHLIALIQEIVLSHQIPLEFTVVRFGHHNDGPHGHFGGKAADCWPLNSSREGDYAGAQSDVMDRFLLAAGRSTSLRQFGLGGTMFTPHNVKLAQQRRGVYVFQDGTQDHAHLGAIFDGS